MIAGEWSVLEEGNPALVMAVNKGVTVEIGESESFMITSASIGVRDHAFDIHKKKIATKMSSKLHLFCTALEAFMHYAGKNAYEPICIDITSDITQSASGEKIGFGSSAAMTVALIAALNGYYETCLSKQEVFNISFYAHYIAQGKKGSGFDIAASVFGGRIVYHKPKVNELPTEGFWDISMPYPGFSVRQLKRSTIHFLVGFSGKSASTPELIDAVNVFKNKKPLEYEKHINVLNTHVSRCIDSLSENLCEEQLDCIREIRGQFQAFQQISGIEFETTQITHMCDSAEGVGCAAKFSGAGGGDSVIGFACDSSELERLTHAWVADGFEIIDVQTDFKGVRAIDLEKD